MPWNVLKMMMLSWVCYVVKGECRTRASSMATLETTSGTLTNYNNKNTGTCSSSNWNLKSPTEQNVILQIDVKYLSLYRAKSCGSENGGYLKLPGERYICKIIRTRSPQCFIFIKDPVPRLCQRQIEKRKECEYSKLGLYGWPGTITYFNDGRIVNRGKGFDLEYKYITCESEPLTTLPLITETTDIARKRTSSTIKFSTLRNTLFSIADIEVQNTTESIVPQTSLDIGSIIGIAAGVIALLILIAIFATAVIFIRRKNGGKSNTEYDSNTVIDLNRSLNEPSMKSTTDPYYIGAPASMPSVNPIREKHAYEGIIMENGREYESIKVRGNTYLKPIKKIFVTESADYEVPIHTGVEENGYIDFR
uniref:uncharacterized protein LOC120342239 n=1 Tax=Styela clava TaxID=7725 RepID=UPI0019392FFE|nr:uncharacterized protein LOC120342239 [Styela clava]